MQENDFDVAIVGGGIIGAATFYKIQQAFPDYKLLLLEKESSWAAHQTGHNSGVIHSGLYYRPGSQRAKLCGVGRRELVEFARTNKIVHDICGKVIVAKNESELPYLEKIYQNGIANQTEGLSQISSKEIQEIEPFCKGVGGLYVECTGIIDFVGVTDACVQITQSIQNHSSALLNTQFLGMQSEGDYEKINTSNGEFRAKKVIFCGGLHSDRLAKKTNVTTDLSIVGFRGDYYELTEQAKHKVKNLIYPVPNPQFPFLGVHFTRMVSGGVECGPNAVFTFKREGYGKTDVSIKDTWEALTFQGTWKLFKQHWKFGLDEYKRAFSKKLFLNQLQQLIPSLEMNDLKIGRAGVRATALGNDGQIYDDFKIAVQGNSIHVLNAPSPAATASLAIAEEIKTMAIDFLGLKNI